MRNDVNNPSGEHFIVRRFFYHVKIICAENSQNLLMENSPLSISEGSVMTERT
jgi:hypothetical protein